MHGEPHRQRFHYCEVYAPSRIKCVQVPGKEDMQTVDTFFFLLVLNNQDEPLPRGSEARLYKLVCNNLITTFFNEYKHYYF